MKYFEKELKQMLQIKNIITEIKNATDGFIRWLDMFEEKNL